MTLKIKLKEIRFCLCGCKTPLPKPRFPSWQRRFISGHQTRGKNHPNFKGGRVLSDDGYIMIWKPDHPFANNHYVFEHGLVMEKFLGRYLTKDEIVHHINDNRQDNRIENLGRMTKGEHLRHHHEIPWNKGMKNPKAAHNPQTFKKGHTPWNRGLPKAKK